MCILRESSVNTSSSAWSHDLGLSHSRAGLFFFFFLSRSSGRINFTLLKCTCIHHSGIDKVEEDNLIHSERKFLKSDRSNFKQ